MKFIKKTVDAISNKVESFDKDIKKIFSDLKEEIVEHYTGVPFVREFKSHKTFERIQLFEFYQEHGSILEDSYNNLDGFENKNNLGKIYKDPAFMINNIIEENKKIVGLIDDNVCEFCMYDGEGLSLILTQNGFEWENVCL